MRRSVVLLAFLALLALQALQPPVGAADRDWVIVSEPTRTMEGILGVDVSAPGFSASEWLLFTPALPNHAGQSSTSALVVPPAKGVSEKSARARKLLLSRVPGRAGNRTRQTWVITYRAQLHARRLVKKTKARGLKRIIPKLTADERRASLRAGGLMDFDAGRFRRWTKDQRLLRKSGEGVIRFGRRVFLDIRSRYTYFFRHKLDRSATAVCGVKSTDCGGLSVLFVSVLRANEIPARCLAGRWAMSASPTLTMSGTPYHQQHVKAEFFADGVGWIPVDLSGAILHDKSKRGLQYFGRDPGDFLVLHVDPAVDMDTVHFGVKHFHWLQFPSWWATGRGTLDGHTFATTWTVKTR